ncbi:hypothetical protein ANN_17247 [Periplaneta americana]|uniref:Uncharacterized protein n=1 Tax=Periplaneta americana TaxID=6978 RepID=A0ABQ8SSE9_PERAM|nr:hypothetical protein ANN_17247 [Periplaneta americana]
MDRVRTEDIRIAVSRNITIVDRIEEKRLTWYGHVQRMERHRLPRQILQWIPWRRKKRGRPGRSWMDRVCNKRSSHKIMYDTRAVAFSNSVVDDRVYGR